MGYKNHNQMKLGKDPVRSGGKGGSQEYKRRKGVNMINYIVCVCNCHPLAMEKAL